MYKHWAKQANSKMLVDIFQRYFQHFIWHLVPHMGLLNWFPLWLNSVWTFSAMCRVLSLSGCIIHRFNFGTAVKAFSNRKEQKNDFKWSFCSSAMKRWEHWGVFVRQKHPLLQQSVNSRVRLRKGPDQTQPPTPSRLNSFPFSAWLWPPSPPPPSGRYRPADNGSHELVLPESSLQGGPIMVSFTSCSECAGKWHYCCRGGNCRAVNDVREG